MKIIRPSWLNSADRSIPKHTMSVCSMDLHLSDHWFCTSGQTDASTILKEQHDCTLCGYVAVWNMHALQDNLNTKKLIWFKHTGPNATVTQVSWLPISDASVLGSVNSLGRFDLWDLKIDQGNQTCKKSKKPIWTKSNAKCFSWGSMAYLAIGGDGYCQIYDWTAHGETIFDESVLFTFIGVCVAVSWHCSVEFLAIAVNKDIGDTDVCIYIRETSQMLSKHNTTANILHSNIQWREDNLLFANESGVTFIWKANSIWKTWIAYTLIHKDPITVIQSAYCSNRSAIIVTLGTMDSQISLWSNDMPTTNIPSKPILIGHDILQGHVTGICLTQYGYDMLLASCVAKSQISSVVLLKLNDDDKFGNGPVSLLPLLNRFDEILELNVSNEDYYLAYTNSITKYKLNFDKIQRFPNMNDKVVRCCASSDLLAFSTNVKHLHVFTRRTLERIINPIMQCGRVLALRAFQWNLLFIEEIDSVSKGNRCMVWNFKSLDAILIADTSIPLNQGKHIIHVCITASTDDDKPCIKVVYSDLRVYTWSYDMVSWIQTYLNDGKNVSMINKKDDNLEELLSIVTFPV